MDNDYEPWLIETDYKSGWNTRFKSGAYRVCRTELFRETIRKRPNRRFEQISCSMQQVLFLSDFEKLNEALETFGRALYCSSRSLSTCRRSWQWETWEGERVEREGGRADSLRKEQDHPWQLDHLWESYLSRIHRIALPEILLWAMLKQSLRWGWRRFAACVVQAFYAISGDQWHAERTEVARETSAQQTTWTTGQYTRFGNISAKIFLDQRPPPVFRACWNADLTALGVPCEDASGVTPTSVRGGGATAMFEATNDTEKVRYQGRLASTKTCEIYVQKVGGHHFLHKDLQPFVIESIIMQSGPSPHCKISWRDEGCLPAHQPWTSFFWRGSSTVAQILKLWDWTSHWSILLRFFAGTVPWSSRSL